MRLLADRVGLTEGYRRRRVVPDSSRCTIWAGCGWMWRPCQGRPRARRSSHAPRAGPELPHPVDLVGAAPGPRSSVDAPRRAGSDHPQVRARRCTERSPPGTPHASGGRTRERRSRQLPPELVRRLSRRQHRGARVRIAAGRPCADASRVVGGTTLPHLRELVERLLEHGDCLRVAAEEIQRLTLGHAGTSVMYTPSEILQARASQSDAMASISSAVGPGTAKRQPAS